MQYMGPWVPALTNAINRQLETVPFITFSFATVDACGAPKVRTCISRGFLFNDRKTNILTFITDIRMDKYEHLKANPKFEASFWFPETNEQFRLSGNAKILTHSNIESFSQEVGDYPLFSPGIIKSYSSSLDLSGLNQTVPAPTPTAEEWENELNSKWDDLSVNLKSSFRKPEPGSKLTPERQKLLDSISRGVDGSNEVDGTKNFSLVLMLVDKVDYVNLNGHQSRFIYERYEEDQWTEDEVCP